MMHAGKTSTAVHFLSPFEPVSPDARKAVEDVYDSPAVEIVVIGPAQTFTEDQAKAIAEQIEAKIA